MVTDCVQIIQKSGDCTKLWQHHRGKLHYSNNLSKTKEKPVSYQCLSEWRSLRSSILYILEKMCAPVKCVLRCSLFISHHLFFFSLPVPALLVSSMRFARLVIFVITV